MLQLKSLHAATEDPLGCNQKKKKKSYMLQLKKIPYTTTKIKEDLAQTNK